MAEPAQLRIRRNFNRPTEAQLAAFASAPTGWIVDAQGRRGRSLTGFAHSPVPTASSGPRLR